MAPKLAGAATPSPLTREPLVDSSSRPKFMVPMCVSFALCHGAGHRTQSTSYKFTVVATFNHFDSGYKVLLEKR